MSRQQANPQDKWAAIADRVFSPSYSSRECKLRELYADYLVWLSESEPALEYEEFKARLKCPTS